MAKINSDDIDIEIKANVKDPKKFNSWKKDKKSYKNQNSAGGGLFFVGFIGSLVYWLQAAVGFGAVVTAFLKSLVWPAYIVYKLLESFYGVVS